MTEGEFATRLGLPAAPAMAEAMIVERDIRLVELTGARYHFGADFHPRQRWTRSPPPRRAGLPITCGVSAHHLALNELDVGSYYTFRKVQAAAALAKPTAPRWSKAWPRGVIDVIVSSHEPQGADTKRQPFAAAAFGTVGLETLLPAALEPSS